MIIPGSEYLNKILHAAAQSLLIPDILALLFFLVLAFTELGAFIAEVRQRKAARSVHLGEVFHDVKGISPWQMKNLQQVIDRCSLSPRQKESLSDLLARTNLSAEDRKLIAKDILDQEEFRAKQMLGKTDLLAKLGPTLGLLGTIIPLGPGLVALGQGDVRELSEAMTVAFDTTVVGVAAGAIGALISLFRHRWYEKELNTLELLLEAIVGGECHAFPEGEAKTPVIRRNQPHGRGTQSD